MVAIEYNPISRTYHVLPDAKDRSHTVPTTRKDEAQRIARKHGATGDVAIKYLSPTACLRTVGFSPDTARRLAKEFQ